MSSWRLRRSGPKRPTASSTGAENLHLSLAQMRTALNSLPMGVIIVEPAGIEWWRNRAAHDLLDAASDASSVQGTLDLMSRRVLRGNAERADLVLQGPPPRNVEIRTVPLVNGGGLIVLEDVTERFLTDRVRTDFVANISHELKTPVGAISLLAETLADLDLDQPRLEPAHGEHVDHGRAPRQQAHAVVALAMHRSEEHTSELQSH